MTSTRTAVRRRLSNKELDTILSAMRTADDTAGLLHATMTSLLGILLADEGRSLSTLAPGEKVNPGRWEIPATQWAAISEAVMRHAARWGTGAHLALELVNLMPASYDDPHAPTPVLDLPDQRPDLHQLHVTRQACDVIAACTAHVHALGEHFGDDSPQYQRAQQTWLHCLSRLFGMGFGAQTHISRDGEFNLLVTTSSGFVYGVIFHGDHRRCIAGDGCAAIIADNGTTYTYSGSAVIANHQHVPAFPLDAPRPGQWSLHS